MRIPANEVGPILFYPTDEFFDKLGKVSGRAARVLFGYLRRLHADRVTATQAEIGEILCLHRTAISKAFQELQEQELVLREWNSVYRVRHFYRGWPDCVRSASCIARQESIPSHAPPGADRGAAARMRIPE